MRAGGRWDGVGFGAFGVGWGWTYFCPGLRVRLEVGFSVGLKLGGVMLLRVLGTIAGAARPKKHSWRMTARVHVW